MTLAPFHTHVVGPDERWLIGGCAFAGGVVGVPPHHELDGRRHGKVRPASRQPPTEGSAQAVPDDDARGNGQVHGQPSGPRLPLGVVVVDDDPTIRRMLVRLFEADGRFTLVATAQDGREAIEVVTAHRPDLVVLDVSMPQMDGIAAAAIIHDESPDVQIVMCSSDHHRRDEAVRAGAELWVDKPLDYARLSSVLLAAATNRWSSSESHAETEPA